MSLSLGTLAAISVDRLLALFLGLTYRQVVTLRRVYVVVIAVWVLSAANATLALLNPDAVKVVQAIGSIMCLITAFFLLHQHFLQVASSTHSSSLHYPQKGEGNNTVEYIRVQKDSVHRALAAGGFGVVLFPVHAPCAICTSRD